MESDVNDMILKVLTVFNINLVNGGFAKQLD